MASITIDDALIEKTEQEIFSLFREEIMPIYKVLDDQIDGIIASLPKEKLVNELQSEYNTLLEEKEKIVLTPELASQLNRYLVAYYGYIDFPNTKSEMFAFNHESRTIVVGYKQNMRESFSKLKKKLTEQKAKEVITLGKKILAFEEMLLFVGEIDIINKQISPENYAEMKNNQPLNLDKSVIYYDVKVNSFNNAQRIMKEIDLEYKGIDELFEKCNKLENLLSFKNTLLNSYGFIQDHNPPLNPAKFISSRVISEYEVRVNAALEKFNPIFKRLQLYREVLAEIPVSK